MTTANGYLQKSPLPNQGSRGHWASSDWLGIGGQRSNTRPLPKNNLWELIPYWTQLEEISVLATYFEVLLLPKHQQPFVYGLTPCQRASGAENELCFVSAMCARSSTRVSKVPGSKISNNVNWLRKELSFLSLFYIFFNFFYIQLFRGPHTSFISANT